MLFVGSYPPPTLYFSKLYGNLCIELYIVVVLWYAKNPISNFEAPPVELITLSVIVMFSPAVNVSCFPLVAVAIYVSN